MFGTTWKDSSRKLGKLFEQLYPKRKIPSQKYFAKYISQYYYYYFSCLEDWLSAAKIHLKFGSGLTMEEQEIRYQVYCYLSMYLLLSIYVHLKFGSGLTTEEQEIRYQVYCYLSTYLYLSMYL